MFRDSAGHMMPSFFGHLAAEGSLSDLQKTGVGVTNAFWLLCSEMKWFLLNGFDLSVSVAQAPA